MSKKKKKKKKNSFHAKFKKKSTRIAGKSHSWVATIIFFKFMVIGPRWNQEKNKMLMYPPPSHGMSHVKNQISIAKGYEDTAWKRFSSSRSQGPGQKSNRQRNRLLHTYPPPKGMSHEKYQIPTTNGSGDIAWTRFSCSRSQDPGERSNQKKKCCCKPTPKGISHKNIKSLLLTAAKI